MNENKILLKIAGINILISTAEDESYARALAEDIDRDVNEILEGNPSASVTNAALLCAIDYLDESRKANRSSNNLRTQIKEYLADAANAKLQLDEERKKTADLTIEIQALRSHLTRVASEGDSSGVIEHLKSDLSKSTNELNRCKKQIADLLTQINGLSEKSAAMSDYISGQDKEIARLNSIIAIHLDSIKSLETQLKSRDEQIVKLAAEVADAVSKLPKPEESPFMVFGGEPEKPAEPVVAPAAVPAEEILSAKDEQAIAEQAHEEVESVIKSLSLDEDNDTDENSQPTFEEIEESIFGFDTEEEDEDEPSEDEEEDGVDFDIPVNGEASKNDLDELGEVLEDDSVEKIFEEPKPPVIITGAPKKESRFAFDIDIDDKPDEYFKHPENDGGMPDLGWTKDI